MQALELLLAKERSSYENELRESRREKKNISNSEESGKNNGPESDEDSGVEDDESFEEFDFGGEGEYNGKNNKNEIASEERKSALSGNNAREYGFSEDKYFARQIDKWDSLNETSYITIGKIGEKSALAGVGLPTGKLYFDVKKLKNELEIHSDHLTEDILKGIPLLLNNPIAITEFMSEKNTVSVYGELYANGTPVVVGIVVTGGRGGSVISKIRTVHARSDIKNQITDKSILYLRENKKEVNAWFQAIGGINVPLGGTQLGVIRSINLSNSIAQKDALVNSNNMQEFEKNSGEDNSSLLANDASGDERLGYSEQNKNMAVENFAVRLNRGFKSENKNITVEVYYDASPNAKRGEWNVKDGKTVIRLNGTLLRGAQSASWVMTHELFHEGAKNYPQLTALTLEAFSACGLYDGSQFDSYKYAYEENRKRELLAELKNKKITEEEYRKELKNEYSREYIEEEIAADLMYRVVGSSELSQMFAEKADKNLLSKLAEFLQTFSERISSVLDKSRAKRYSESANTLAGVFERAVKENKVDSSSETENKYALVRIPREVSDFVDKSLSHSLSDEESLSLGKMPNDGANKIKSERHVDVFGSERQVDARHITHAKNRHGFAPFEMLKGQLAVTKDDIKQTLAQIKIGNGNINEITGNQYGTLSVVWELPVNGYTYYVEEIMNPLQRKSIVDGRTIWKTPTSAGVVHSPLKGASPNQNLPSASDNSIRRSVVKVYNKNVNVLCQNGRAAEYFVLGYNGIAKIGDFGEVYYLSSNRKDIAGDAVSAYVAANNPYFVSANNPIVSKEATTSDAKAAIEDIKNQGYDSIVMDYHDGDNYSVIVFDKANIYYSDSAKAQVEKAFENSHVVEKRSALSGRRSYNVQDVQDDGDGVIETRSAIAGNSGSRELENARKNDTEYLELAKNPEQNEAKLREMVDEAAVKAGVETDSEGKPIPLYHGTRDFGFTSIDTNYSDDKLTFWATPELAIAESYHDEEGAVREIGKVSDRDKAQRLDYNDSALKIVETAKSVLPEYKDAVVPSEIEKLKVAKRDIAKATKIANKILRSKELTAEDETLAREFLSAANNGTCEALANACNLRVKISEQKQKALNDVWSNGDASKYNELMADFADYVNEIYEAVRPDLVYVNGEEAYTGWIVKEYNNRIGETGTYQLYYKADNPYIIDCEGVWWNKIVPPAEMAVDGDTVNTRDVAKWAFEHGYDSVKFLNVIDTGFWEAKRTPATVWAFMNPKEQLWSADAITYDDNGNVIPLSERFNKANDDIRFALSNSGITNENSVFGEAAQQKVISDENIQEVLSWLEKNYSKDSAEYALAKKITELERERKATADKLTQTGKAYRIKAFEVDEAKISDFAQRLSEKLGFEKHMPKVKSVKGILDSFYKVMESFISGEVSQEDVAERARRAAREIIGIAESYEEGKSKDDILQVIPENLAAKLISSYLQTGKIKAKMALPSLETLISKNFSCEDELVKISESIPGESIEELRLVGQRLQGEIKRIDGNLEEQKKKTPYARILEGYDKVYSEISAREQAAKFILGYTAE